MNNQNGFSRRGNWYKGNLHSHTTISDGNFTPEDAAEQFQMHGYSFLCISDHNQYTDYRKQFNNEKFIILPGLEAAAVLFNEKDSCIKVHHINGILGTSKMQKAASNSLFQHMERLEPQVYYHKWDSVQIAQDIIDKLHAKGCIVTYNHPIWSRVEAEEVAHLKNVDILEIFNYNTENESGTGFNTTYWDTMLRSGNRVLADASDDNHNDEVFDDAFGGYIMVKAESLTHDNIMNAILSGNYYSSSGPVINDWGIRDGKVYISCSAASRINFIAGGFVGAGTTVIAKDGEQLITCEVPLNGNETYIRVECIDEKGHKAWTNPLFIK